MMTVNADPGGRATPDATASPASPQSPAARDRWTAQPVRSVRRWTDTLLSFRIGRDAAFRFVPGQYARLGLAGADGEVVWRPFSMVSAPDDEHLEFVATLVPGGAFSTLLAGVGEGDAVLVDRSAFGFLTVDRVAAGRHLWLLASGTGLGPFVSMLRDAAAWDAFETIVLAHSVRREDELAYRAELEALAAQDAMDAPRAQLRYLPIVTRHAVPGLLGQRIPQLIERGDLQQAAGVSLSVADSRVLVCGNPEMSAALRGLLTARGFVTPRRGLPGQMAFENYW